MLARKEIFAFLSSGCLFSLPSGVFWMAWGLEKVQKHSGSGIFSVYAPDFFLENSTPWILFPENRRVSREDLIRSLKDWVDEVPQGGAGATLGAPKWISPDFESFRTVFGDLQAQIESKTLKKAVPVVFSRAHFQMDLMQRAESLLRVLAATRDLPVYLYGVWNQNEGILGATPEILVQGRDGSFSTMALAGTRLNGSENRPILEDPKERAEHQIVIDGILASLRSLDSVKDIQVALTQELKLPLFSHLLTPISFRMDVVKPSSAELEGLVKALHPTPALGAFPRTAGFEWLRRQKNSLERKRFGAPLGFVSPSGEIQLGVAIRNLQWSDQEVILGAGCGIIAESVLDREWKELAAKMNSVKKLWGWEISL